MSTSSQGPAYDRIGVGYGEVRRPDPSIATQIETALGDAHTVLNVGAGTGCYEPLDREVTAVEPSAEMIAQRPSGSFPVVQASAEELPFGNGSFDAAMAILSDHHWRGRAVGLREMSRVARQRVLILNADPSLAARFWLTRDYLPGVMGLIPEQYRQAGYWREELRSLLGEVTVRAVPVPRDCQDGFYQAYWGRPRAYLDASVRRGTSIFHRLPESEVGVAMERLARDIEDGTWEERHGDLHGKPELDVGLRLVVAELPVATCGSA